MNNRLPLSILLLATISSASAQVASHAQAKATPMASAPVAQAAPIAIKPVARVNGVVLTNQDLLREMYEIFPYARVHNGFPKAQEPQIRQGAMDMIVFEELVYQEAARRHLAVSPESIARSEREFRKQFHSEAEFQAYLKAEVGGSPKVLREKIKRSLMIEALLKSEVSTKMAISEADLKAYYDKNSLRFQHGESVSIQTISILPPKNANPEQLREARKRADDANRLAQATKTYEDFGMLAEKVSDDDFHVRMGDHKSVEIAKLPPEIVAAIKTMKPGQVSKLIQLGPNFSIVRVNAHLLAGKTKFEEVKKELRDEQQKIRYNQLRANLNQRLKKNAKIEIL
jgi:parvulin-like peptidyl-prolyl isomerase